MYTRHHTSLQFFTGSYAQQTATVHQKKRVATTASRGVFHSPILLIESTVHDDLNAFHLNCNDRAYVLIRFSWYLILVSNQLALVLNHIDVACTYIDVARHCLRPKKRTPSPLLIVKEGFKLQYMHSKGPV